MNSVYRKDEGKKNLELSMNRAVAVLTMVAVICGMFFGMAGRPVYADAISDLIIDFEGDYFASQGAQDVKVTFSIKNNAPLGGSTYNYRAELSVGNDLSVSSGNSTAATTLEPGDKDSRTFKIDVARRASVNSHTLTLILYDSNSGAKLTEKRASIEIAEDLNPQSSAKNAAVDIVYKLSNEDGIIAGDVTTINLEIFNRGNTEIKNAQVSLNLPDGMSINNAAGYVNAGYILVGSTFKCKFPLTGDETLTSKNYPITVKITGADSSNDSVSLEQTLYIPVKGTGEKLSAKDIEITGISIPQQVMAGDEFTLAFDVANRGTSSLKDAKVTVEVPEGLANKTKNVFVITGLEAGKTQRCSLTLFSPKKTEKDEYQMLKITAEASSSSSSGENSGKTVTVSQYAGTMVKNLGGAEKTPQLMISNYSYGGSYVQAGDDFGLNLGLYNTSATQDLVNVKVTVTADDGTFIPVKSSNAFFVDKIEAKGSAAHSIVMNAKRDAEQKTYSLTVDMSYEDTAGNAFTSKDVISIPVMQETRLVVDDLVAPPELYTGMQSSLSVEFYNMGKTVLNNLRVNVEGDFDASQSNMYYVGNMETGKSDSYDFTFIPRQSGPMTGTVTFTYEDAAGNEQRYEKPFEVTIMEEVPWEDPGMMDPTETEKKIPWIPISIAGAAAVAVIGLIVWRKHRKKKREQEMEIDE